MQSEIDSQTGEPLDELSDLAKKWLISIDTPYNTMQDVIASGPDEKVKHSRKLTTMRYNQIIPNNFRF